MKQKKYKPFRANWQNLYTILISVWLMDFWTTVLALNLPRFKGVLTELNPLGNYFFSLGWWGYAIAFIYSFITIFCLSFFSCKLINRLKNEDFRANLYYGIMFLFILLEGNAIYNNIIMMMRFW